jgi:hypothetical protein
MTIWRFARVAAERAQEEEEMAEFQELYAAWAMLHRMRKHDSGRNPARWQ